MTFALWSHSPGVYCESTELNLLICPNESIFAAVVFVSFTRGLLQLPAVPHKDHILHTCTQDCNGVTLFVTVIFLCVTLKLFFISFHVYTPNSAWSSFHDVVSSKFLFHFSCACRSVLQCVE